MKESGFIIFIKQKESERMLDLFNGEEYHAPAIPDDVAFEDYARYLINKIQYEHKHKPQEEWTKRDWKEYQNRTKRLCIVFDLEKKPYELWTDIDYRVLNYVKQGNDFFETKEQCKSMLQGYTPYTQGDKPYIYYSMPVYLREFINTEYTAPVIPESLPFCEYEDFIIKNTPHTWVNKPFCEWTTTEKKDCQNYRTRLDVLSYLYSEDLLNTPEEDWDIHELLLKECVRLGLDFWESQERQNALIEGIADIP